MAFPITDPLGLSKSGLLEIKYQGSNFTICRVAQWAYMAVMVLEDTTDDEYAESRVTIAGWHIDAAFAKQIMENNNLFAATMLSKQRGKEPDLVATYSSGNSGQLEQIYHEIQTGVRKPMEDPAMDRVLKEEQTRKLRLYLDKYGENPRFSPKKVWPGILMLLLYPLGLPFFYFGKKLWGGIALGCFVVACALPVLLIPVAFMDIVFIVMLLVQLFGDKIKDKEGNLVCTKAKQKRILESIAQYKKNVAELEAEGGDA